MIEVCADEGVCPEQVFFILLLSLSIMITQEKNLKKEKIFSGDHAGVYL